MSSEPFANDHAAEFATCFNLIDDSEDPTLSALFHCTGFDVLQDHNGRATKPTLDPTGLPDFNDFFDYAFASRPVRKVCAKSPG